MNAIRPESHRSIGRALRVPLVVAGLALLPGLAQATLMSSCASFVAGSTSVSCTLGELINSGATVTVTNPAGVTQAAFSDWAQTYMEPGGFSPVDLNNVQVNFHPAGDGIALDYSFLNGVFDSATDGNVGHFELSYQVATGRVQAGVRPIEQLSVSQLNTGFYGQGSASANVGISQEASTTGAPASGISITNAMINGQVVSTTPLEALLPLSPPLTSTSVFTTITASGSAGSGIPGAQVALNSVSENIAFVPTCATFRPGDKYLVCTLDDLIHDPNALSFYDASGVLMTQFSDWAITPMNSEALDFVDLSKVQAYFHPLDSGTGIQVDFSFLDSGFEAAAQEGQFEFSYWASTRPGNAYDISSLSVSNLDASVIPEGTPSTGNASVSISETSGGQNGAQVGWTNFDGVGPTAPLEALLPFAPSLPSVHVFSYIQMGGSPGEPNNGIPGADISLNGFSEAVRLQDARPDVKLPEPGSLALLSVSALAGIWLRRSHAWPAHCATLR